ncbi:hypothetical protein SFRURICE_015225 [Spodoptera frugiperda]|nr:hypothetical protein SFRURICE_015225 [Spodoptera frugiperda]
MEPEYYMQLKKENAHEDSIWCCGWSNIEKEKPKEAENDDVDPTQETINEPSSENYLITGGLDDLIKVWQLENGKLEEKHQLEGHSLGVISVAVSPDGKTLASSSQDSSLILWDLTNGEKIKTMETGPTDVWTLDFSPDGKHVISGSNAGKILIFGVESGKQEQTLDTRGKFTLSVAYSPDGKYIASGALDGIINIFDVAQGKLVHTLEGHAMPIRSLCFSPDSQLLLTASDDGHMKLYDVVHANLAGTLSGHASWVLSVAFSPDGKRFASGSADRTVRVWDLDSMQCQHVFKEHSDQVWGVKVPSKDFIVTGGLDCLVKVWTLQNDRLQLIHTLKGHRMAVVSVAVSPTAPIIASSSLDSSLIFWDLGTGKMLTEIPTGASDVWKMAFSGDGEHLCTGGHTGKVHIYGVKSGTLDKVLDTRGKFILSVACSGNSKYIATGAEDGVLCILDVTQAKVVHTVQAHTKPIRNLAFSPCNKRLATVSNDGFARLYDVASAGLQYSLNLKCWAVGICFSGDGTRIATAAADGTVRVLLTEGLIVLNTFQEHTDMSTYELPVAGSGGIDVVITAAPPAAPFNEMKSLCGSMNNSGAVRLRPPSPRSMHPHYRY